MSSALSKRDTIYVDGTEATPSVGIKMGKVGECFDKNRTLHVYNPWRNNSVYREKTIYLSIDGVRPDSVLEEETKVAGPAQEGLAFDEGYRFWLSLNFSDSIVSSASWKSEDAKVQIIRDVRENILIHYFSEKNRPLASDLFPSGVYETWFFTSSTMEDLDLSYARAMVAAAHDATCDIDADYLALLDEISIVFPNPSRLFRLHHYQYHDEVTGFFVQDFQTAFRRYFHVPTKFHIKAYNIPDDAELQYFVWRRERSKLALYQYIAKEYLPVR